MCELGPLSLVSEPIRNKGVSFKIQMSELDSNPTPAEVVQDPPAPAEEEHCPEVVEEACEPKSVEQQSEREQSQDLAEGITGENVHDPEAVPEDKQPSEGASSSESSSKSSSDGEDNAADNAVNDDAAGGDAASNDAAQTEAENLEETQSSKHKPQMQLTNDEIAYGLSYFSHQHGYTNQFNVVTPDLFQKRMRPICELSLHGCEHLLRAPFNGSINGRAVGGQARGDQGGAGVLGKRICLTPAQVSEIMNYRVGPSDDIDFALESFKMLGATSINDAIPIEKVADLLISAYRDIETQLEESKDFQSICECLIDKNTQLEKIKAKSEGREVKKVSNNVRAVLDPSRPRTPPRLKTPSGLSRKAVVDPRCQYAIPLRDDILHVLRQCCIGEHNDKMDYTSWKEIFTTLLSMRFVDYREEITQMGH